MILLQIMEKTLSSGPATTKTNQTTGERITGGDHIGILENIALKPRNICVCILLLSFVAGKQMEWCEYIIALI